MIGHDFPYLDTRDLNLDWLLRNMKQILADWAEYQQTMNQNFADLQSAVDQFETDVTTAFDNLHDYVEDYFDNLDVQQEINNKLDDMKRSGELAQIMNPLIATETGNWLSAHITNPSNPPIDTSLTVSGAAADAKVTGDRTTKNVRIVSPFAYDVYKSTSHNLLDVDHYIEGISVYNTAPYLRADQDGKMSTLVYVENLHGQNITMSGYTEPLCVLFLSDAKFDNTANVSEFNYTGTSRTITVPYTAKYAVFGFTRGDSTSHRTHDFSNMKVSDGSGVTTDAFEGEFLWNVYAEQRYPLKTEAVKENNLIILSSSDNVLNTAVYTQGVRVTDTAPYFRTDFPQTILSAPVYVNGQSKITIRSSNTSNNIRFIAFTTKPVADSDDVIGVSSQFVTQATSTPTDYVVSVPDGAVWAFITLKARDSGDDWPSDTAAYGSTGTNDSYLGTSLGGITSPHTGTPYLIDFKSTSDTSDYEKNKVESEFIPLTIGAPANITFGRSHDRFNLLFFADSHIDRPLSDPAPSLDNVKQAIAFSNNFPVTLDAVVHAGDVVTDSGVILQSAFIGYLGTFFNVAKLSNLPLLFSIGNHDTNDWGNIPANVMTDTAWGTAWLDFAETQYGIIRQTKANTHKSTWHYKDFPDKKIRIVSVDVQDTDKSVTDSNGKVYYNGQTSWYISQAQMSWIIGTALNFDDKEEQDWGVIFVLHQVKGVNGTYYATSRTPAYESAIEKLVHVCKAFNTQTSYSDSYTFATDNFYNLNIAADFTRYATLTNKPYIICWLTGHEHFDRYDTVEGINMIWTLSSTLETGSADSRVARVPGTVTQNSFDMISVDTTERKIRVVRYGAGKNCFGAAPYDFMPNGLSF